ncbi:GntR family transcriptional regulator [Aeromicrobium sp. P5_D10]
MSTRAESSYSRVARELRAQILQGAFSDGQRLPTEAELSADYSMSRQTIRRAFQELVSEGMVYRIPGRGTFAQSASDGYIRQVGSVDDLMGLSDDTGMEILEPLARRVDLISAGRLRLTSDAVFRLELVRTHDGTRFCITTVFLPPHVGRELIDVPELTTAGAKSELTIIGLIDARLKDPIAEAQQSITVEVAGEREAAYLGCDIGHPLLRVDRLYLDTNGQAVELATSHFLPEHYSYRISLRRNG